MIRKAIFLSTAISLLAASGCTTTSAPSVNTNTNSNANTAIVVDTSNTTNPIAGNVSAPPAATNSSVPGIPNAPSDVKITKEDPTRGNVKIQSAGTAAPDNSEITIALGENAIETRTFKNHPQLAKVERIQDIANKKTTVKVYLRNGQVRELAEGAVKDAMGAPALELYQAASNSGAAKPEPKAATESQTAAPPKPGINEKRGPLAPPAKPQ